MFTGRWPRNTISTGLRRSERGFGEKRTFSDEWVVGCPIFEKNIITKTNVHLVWTKINLRALSIVTVKTKKKKNNTSMIFEYRGKF